MAMEISGAPSILSFNITIGGPKTVVLLEDNPEHADAAREIVERHGYQVIVASDWQSIRLLAECGARFFVLDIKLGEGPDRVQGGLRALEILRLRYGRKVFIAVLTMLLSEHERKINKLGADIAIQKSNNQEADMNNIISRYEEWQRQEIPSGEVRGGDASGETSLESIDADLLFPSDPLAVEITGASLNELKQMLQERRAIARALGDRLPHIEDLRREIGDRMRDELRGVLMELSERAMEDRTLNVKLTEGARLTKDLARLVYRYLPITYGADSILDQLWNELHQAAYSELSGEWGTVHLDKDGEVVLVAGQGDNLE